VSGFFNSFFRKKPAASDSLDDFTQKFLDGFDEIYDPGNMDDRIGLALLVVLQHQLRLLGFETGKVPYVAPFSSKRCRGYLYGLAMGVMECENIPPNPETFIGTLIATFGLVFGDPFGRDVVDSTDNELLKKDREVVSGISFGEADIRRIYSGEGVYSAEGFYLLANAKFKERQD
jgi:hypothetical protein